MKGTPAIYLGRIVEKKHFRTFVYGSNGEKKLVESWDAFEVAMESGIWFATIEDAQANKAIVNEQEEIKVKPKAKSKLKTKIAQVEEADEPAESVEKDGMVFEVVNGS